mgnify:CR=1 FL=1
MKRKLIACMALFLLSGVTTVGVNAQEGKKRFTLPTPWTEEAAASRISASANGARAVAQS